MQENINQNDLKIDQKNKSKKGMKWAIVVIIIALVLWGIIVFLSGMLGVGQGGSAPIPEYKMIQLLNDVQPKSSISDTREFMKVNYSGHFKTRNVKEIAKQAVRIIRGFDGRIDGNNVSEEGAYISFVVAKKDFEDMRDELGDLVHEKLYTEQVNEQNLLNQKQTIETNQQNTVSNIQTLEQQKEILIAGHNKKVAQYTRQIKEKEQSLHSINGEYTRLESWLATVDITIEEKQKQDIILNNLKYQEITLSQEIQKLKQNLSNENTQYTTNLNNLKNGISLRKDDLVDLAKQDKDFTENIETVAGNISIEHVTWWQLLKVFSPIHPVFLIIGLWFIIYLITRKYYTQLNTFFGFK